MFDTDLNVNFIVCVCFGLF